MLLIYMRSGLEEYFHIDSNTKHSKKVHEYTPDDVAFNLQ